MLQKAQQVVFDRLTTLIETSGKLPWQCPWNNERPGNATSKTKYNGVNAFLAGMDTACNGYRTGRYMTYKQALDNGLTVREGSKALPIIYYSVKEKQKATGEIDKMFIARYFSAFNLDQLDGDINKFLPGATDTKDFPDLMLAINTNRFPDVFTKRQDMAFYSPSEDYINLPVKSSFADSARYYSTLLHEIGHSTGHKSRLNRYADDTKWSSFGSEAYSKEELIAEFSASFLCAHYGIENTAAIAQSASYLSGWTRYLKDKPKELFSAASQADKILTYLTSWDDTDTASASNFLAKFK
jgi:antirestriction protein ArdC